MTPWPIINICLHHRVRVRRPLARRCAAVTAVQCLHVHTADTDSVGTARRVPALLRPPALLQPRPAPLLLRPPPLLSMCRYECCESVCCVPTLLVLRPLPLLHVHCFQVASAE